MTATVLCVSVKQYHIHVLHTNAYKSGCGSICIFDILWIHYFYSSQAALGVMMPFLTSLNHWPLLTSDLHKTSYSALLVGFHNIFVCPPCKFERNQCLDTLKWLLYSPFIMYLVNKVCFWVQGTPLIYIWKIKNHYFCTFL